MGKKEEDETEKEKIIVFIQLLCLNPPYLMDICFDAKRLTSCKYPSDRALGIIFMQYQGLSFMP